MRDTEQDYGAQRTYQQRCAQVHAYEWASRATVEYNLAIKHEDDARARQDRDHAYQRERMAEERRQAQFHGVRSTEALKLATMWAHVAQALADGELPFTNVVEVRGSHDEVSLTDSLANPNIAG
ncbi:hypothetical protein [Streptomyces sp. NPDC006997]|uniref:hypothetical protein n=1 Tax=Streptomyces sp. NPDC006997 TaxID=3155356 RepID=UPI0033FB74C4